jgi:hypothetical protein
LLAATEERPALVTGRSVIFVFQQGGPSQFETFDPKPDAPQAIRTLTGTIPTSLPGVRFGETMTRLARLADKLTVVRSFQTNNANHNLVPVVGPDTLQATIGALYSRVAGAIHPGNGTPTNAVLFPQSVSPDVKKGTARGNITATGGLGQTFAPFIPGAGSQQQRNMQLVHSRERLDDRRQLLSAFDRLGRRIEGADKASGLDRFHEQAYRLLLGRGVADALDLSRESPKVVASKLRHQPLRPGRPLEQGAARAARLLRRPRGLAGQAPSHGATIVRGGLRIRYHPRGLWVSGTCTLTLKT